MPRFHVSVETVHEAANAYEAVMAMLAEWRTGEIPKTFLCDVFEVLPDGKVDVSRCVGFDRDDVLE